MTCRDFDDLWNARLDGSSGAPPGALAAMDAHASSCPSCRALAVGYQAILQASWAPPAVPGGLGDRILAAWGEDRPASPRLLAIRPRFAWISVAAACGLGLLLAQPWRTRPKPSGSPALSSAAPGPPRPLTFALAEATSATLDLAREASGPTARVGRRVLVTARRPEPPWPSPLDPVAAGGVLQTVGERVGAGVRPLSGSARRAFGFLMGPASSTKADSPPSRSGA